MSFKIIGSCLNLVAFDKAKLDETFSPYDVKRLDSYSKNLVDFHAIIDLVPVLARLYFLGTLSDELAFSAGQSCILLGIGLQAKSIEDVAVRPAVPAFS